MWTSVQLADVCQIKPPKAEARNQLKPNDEVSFVPMADLGELSKSFSASDTRPLSEVIGSYTYFADGDVLFAKITPCFENGKLGIARDLGNGVGFGSSEFVVLRPSKDLDAEYLFYFLSRDDFRREGTRIMTGAAGHKRVPKDFIENYEIPIPSLPEQQRIVAILDETFEAIDAAIANTQQNLANAQILFVRAVETQFLESTSPASCERVTVSDLADETKGSIRTGPFGSQLLHSEFVDEGIAVLGIDNAVDNQFQWKKRRFITHEKFQELSRYQVKPGDVLITIMGTCGRCAIVPDDIPVAINSKHLCCITLNRDRCLPEFLHAYFLYHPTTQDFLRRRAKGAVMDGLNMGIIKELPVMLPDLNTQKSIAEAINRLRTHTSSLVDLYDQKLAVLLELKQSILRKAFSGELTAEDKAA